MNLLRFSAWLFVALVCESEVCLAQSGGAQTVITWDDLTVDSLQVAQGSQEDRVIVVDPNGHGDALTIGAAVQMVPTHNAQRVKIHILPGVYREKIFIPASKPYISFIGNPRNPSQTVITWHDKASDPDGNGGEMGTYRSATVSVDSDYFCATGITFENTVAVPAGGGEGYQAVAMRTAGDKCVFYKVRFLGSQDTLLDQQGTHYFYKCFIQGATDFIFGDAKSLYQECTISVVSPGYAIAAQKRETGNEDTGFSFVKCRIIGSANVYLGRAWGDYSQITYSLCVLDVGVAWGGWQDWGAPSRHNTVTFGEYQCTGRGADRTGRVPWSKALSYAEAKPFLDTAFINGEQWLRL